MPAPDVALLESKGNASIRCQSSVMPCALSRPLKLCVYLIGIVVSVCSSIAPAQSVSVATGTIRGVVLQMPQGSPVRFAKVSIADQRTISDSAGVFWFSGLPVGIVEVRAESPNLAARTLSVHVVVNDTTRVFIRLASHAVQLDQFVVTAQESQATSQGSSVSRISRDAIEHVQASSLADILQLVPGQPALNPSLASPRQSLLRQAPTSSSRDPGAGTEAERANALGTSVVIDGVPVSNNANLQTTLTILNSGPSALPQFASTAGRGVDLRQFPADNIETVEVIRGIPSARHGDLTTGAILVTSRAGQQRPELRLRANPLTLEMSSVAGWRRSARNGVSIDAGLVRSQDDPRSTLDRFTRATTQLAWSAQPTPRISSTLRVRGYTVLDEAKRDPDDKRYQRIVSSRDRGGRADLRVALLPASSRGWRSELSASASYATQVGKYQELVTRDIFALTDVRRDTIAPGKFGRSEYLGRLTVDGAPLNVFARFETTGDIARGTWRHEPVVGVEFRADANRGEGRSFDALQPPRQNYGVGDRPDDFSNVRSQIIVALYIEHRVRGLIGGTSVDATAGVRVDLVDPSLRATPVLASPRINAQWRPWSFLAVRGGYGVTTKSPTLSQRYPLPRYFDLVSYNYYPTTPAERLVVFTTKVVDPTPQQLTSARARKIEGAVEWRLRSATGTVTAFSEQTRNAFGTTRIPIGILVPKYRALSFPVGQTPVLDAVAERVDRFVGLFDAPRNSRSIHTRGVEITADAPEIRAIRTSLSLSGAWFATQARDTDVEIPVDQFLSGTTQPAHVGVYPGGNGSEASRVLTTLRVVHRLPEAGLAASVILQTTWSEDDRPLGRLDSLPIGFVDQSGTITALTPQQALLPEYQSFRRPVLLEAARWERRPPLHLVNLRITKTLPGRTQLALFANNALANLPLYQRQRQTGFERRNQAQFFGIEFLAAFNLTPILK